MSSANVRHISESASRSQTPAAIESQPATMFSEGYDLRPLRPESFFLSFAVHTLVVALALVSSHFAYTHRKQISQQVTLLVSDISPYVLPASATRSGGGGGGGDRDKLQASKGALPKFARKQIAPPVVVVRNENPKLPVEPTVVVPPDIRMPQSAVLGDPLSSILGPPSSGTGSGGGIGSGSGGGVGSGRGPGVGPGWGGGIGGGAYRVGGGVSAPRLVYGPEPEFSEEARKAKFQGVAVLWAIVGADGRVRDLRVQRSLGMGLDEKAVEAVKTWRFEPARKDGTPVAVQIAVEVSFRLY
jgi:protein TonB